MVLLKKTTFKSLRGYIFRLLNLSQSLINFKQNSFSSIVYNFIRLFCKHLFQISAYCIKVFNEGGRERNLEPSFFTLCAKLPLFNISPPPEEIQCSISRMFQTKRYLIVHVHSRFILFFLTCTTQTISVLES